MDTVKALMVSLLFPKVEAIWPIAGAIIAEETGLMKVNADTIAVAAHLRLKLQLYKGYKLNNVALLTQRTF